MNARNPHLLITKVVVQLLVFVAATGVVVAVADPVVPAEFRPNFSVDVSDEELQALRVFPQPLAPMEELGVSGENAALGAAVMSFCSRIRESDTAALEQFVADFPSSRWNAALCLNIGSWKYSEGSFSEALQFWNEAWSKSKAAKEYPTKFIRDAAAAQAGRMNARLGNREWLDDFVAELASMDVAGSAAESLMHTKAAHALMHSDPSQCFMCGPYALLGILPAGISPEVLEEVRRPQSTLKGTSLAQVHELSKRTGISYQPAFRSKGSNILAPAVVHWSVGHFGAVVEEKDGGLLIKDPTFGDEVFMSPEIFDRESSGYFLVPAGELPAGWRSVDEAEASTVWGKGLTSTQDSKETRTDCITVGGCKDKGKGAAVGKAMAVYDVQAMLVSLTLSDTPVTYSPAFGPEVSLTISYNQRDVAQPDNKNYSNLGMKWTHSFLSYLTVSGTTATIAEPGGGSTTFEGFNSSTGSFTFHKRSASSLVKESAMRFVRTFADGGKQMFSTFDGSRYFLTQTVNRIGHTITLSYDSLFRLVRIADAAGMETVLGYDGTDLKIRSITDPFGRQASIEYDSSGRLVAITDPVGITSRFTYSASDAHFINALETPYGVTKFSFGAEGLNRWLEVTDPAGDVERTEYRSDTSAINYGSSDPIGSIPADTSQSYLNYRNTFYWDKKAYAEAKGDYTKAVIYHWCHEPPGYSVTSGVLESIKRPFESRVCFTYAGQAAPYNSILVDSNVFTARPARILRKLSLGNTAQDTQEYAYTFNSIGLPLTAKDPMGRETRYTYDPANDRDVIKIERKNGAAYDLLASATYDARGLPLIVTDAAGQRTSMTYNTQGQVLTVTNPKDETTTNVYDSLGRLSSVDGPLPGTADTVTFAYDPVVLTRVRSVTDPDGRTTSYEYDNLDRVTKVTYSDGKFEQIIYGRLDPEWIRDRAGRWTRLWHNSIRQRVAQMDPGMRTTLFSWCRCGDLRTITDGNGNTTTWKHDVGGRITEKVYADGSKEAYLYDLAGRLQKVTPPSGKARDYAYFRDNTLKSLVYPDGSGTATNSFTYGAAYARLESMTDPSGATAWTYHAVTGSPALGAGQLASVDGPLEDDTISYQYDALGRVVRKAMTGQARELTFDAAGRLTAETNPLGAFSYAYEASSGRVVSVTGPNGLVSAFTYQSSPQLPFLSSISHSVGSSPISSFTYDYDAVGNITRWGQVQNGEPTTWNVEMDASDQLRAVTGDSSGTQSFTYDKAGNRLSKQVGQEAFSYSYNNLNQLLNQASGGNVRVAGTLSEPANVTVQGKPAQMLDASNFVAYPSVNSGTNIIPITAADGSGNARTNSYRVVVPSTGTQNFAYDANGNQLSDGGKTYEWDALDRLAKITKGTNVFEFGYDGMNRRIWEKVNGVTAKRFVWDQLQIVQERSAANEVMQRFFAQGQKGADESLTFYTRDHQGSVREVLGVDGTVSMSCYYDPWGKPFAFGSGTLNVPFRFTGHPYHSETETVFAPLRAYGPHLARWLSRDPFGSPVSILLAALFGTSSQSQYEAGINRPELLSLGRSAYEYVRNNPIVLVDPEGEIAPALILAGGIVIAIILNPDVANAPGPGDPTYSSCGMIGTAKSTIFSPMRIASVSASLGKEGAEKLIEKGVLRAVSPKSPITPVSPVDFIKK